MSPAAKDHLAMANHGLFRRYLVRRGKYQLSSGRYARLGFFFFFLFFCSVWFFVCFRRRELHGTGAKEHTHNRRKNKGPALFHHDKDQLPPSLPGQVSSRWRQRGMGEREEVKGHSWVGRECQGAGVCRLEGGGGPAGGEGKLTRWHGMWCRAVKGAGLGGRGEGRTPPPPPPVNTPVINGTQEVAWPMCHSK